MRVFSLFPVLAAVVLKTRTTLVPSTGRIGLASPPAATVPAIRPARFAVPANGTNAGTGSPVDVSGKTLSITTAGGTYSSETIGGFITIVTDE